MIGKQRIELYMAKIKTICIFPKFCLLIQRSCFIMYFPMEVIMRKLLFLSVTTLMLVASSLQATMPPDSCLLLLPHAPDQGWMNPDSVLQDTCTPPVEERYFAKQYFKLVFTYNVIPRDTVYKTDDDAVIEYRWQDILPQYSQTRAAFEQLEQEYGAIYFRDLSITARDTVNSPHPGQSRQRSLFLRFTKYVEIDSMVERLKTIPLVYYPLYSRRFGGLAGIDDEQTESKGKSQCISVSHSQVYSVLSNVLQMHGSIEIYNILGSQVGYCTNAEQIATLIPALSPGSLYYIKTEKKNSSMLVLVQ